MKKTLIVLVLPLFTTIACAQNRIGFGFLMKAGTYSLGGERTGADAQELSINGSFRQTPGAILTLGIWQELPLSRRFKVRTEFLYRYASYRTELTNHILVPNGPSLLEFTHLSDMRFGESGIAIPVKLYYHFKAQRKFSAFIGGAISHLISLTRSTKINVSSTLGIEKPRFFEENYRFWDDFYFKRTVIFGLEFSLSSQTSLAIEYNFEKNDDYRPKLDPSLQQPLDVCGCGVTSFWFQTDMNSLSLAIHHNIL